MGAVTIMIFSENNMKKNKNPRLNFNARYLKPMLKLLNGELSTRLMLFNAQKNLKKLRRSSQANFKIWKNNANPPRPSVLPLKKLNSVKLVKSKIFKSTSNAPTVLLPHLIKNNATSIKFLQNTNKKKKSSRLNLKPLKKKLDLFLPNSSKLRMPMKKHSMVLRL